MHRLTTAPTARVRSRSRRRPDSPADASAASLPFQPASLKSPLVFGPDVVVAFVASARVSRCATAFTAPPAVALAPFHHHLRCLRPGSRRAVPSVRRHLHRVLGRAAFLTPVRPRRALFPSVASRAPVRFSPRPLPLRRLSTPPSCRRSGAVMRARTGPSYARPWAARTLRRPRPSQARLGRVCAA
jgi:hypothetical protein